MSEQDRAGPSEPHPPGGADPGTGHGADPPAHDGPPYRLPEVEGDLDRALALVRFLRRHCPWDASQTPESLVPHLLEETHEVVAAIRAGDDAALEDELGDLLLNLAFQVVLGEEEEQFDAETVAERLVHKMKQRHPHLFGLGEPEDWERIKARNRPDRGVLEGLPADLEPLTRAHRIQERVSGVGFDWADPAGAWDKAAEELDEVRDALEREAPDELEEELGDLLFAAVNLVRLTGHHPATVLAGANRKFTARFARLEALAAERDIDLGDASLTTLDGLWNELKAGPDEPGGEDAGGREGPTGGGGE